LKSEAYSYPQLWIVAACSQRRDVLRQLCLQLFDPLRDIAGLGVNID
jgi:hypothetical protein